MPHQVNVPAEARWSGSVLQRHRPPFTLLFAALMAASLIVAAVVLLRARRAPV